MREKMLTQTDEEEKGCLDDPSRQGHFTLLEPGPRKSQALAGLWGPEELDLTGKCTEGDIDKLGECKKGACSLAASRMGIPKR